GRTVSFRTCSGRATAGAAGCEISRLAILSLLCVGSSDFRNRCCIFFEQPALAGIQILREPRFLLGGRFSVAVNDFAENDFVYAHFAREMVLPKTLLENSQLEIRIHCCSILKRQETPGCRRRMSPRSLLWPEYPHC